MKVGGAVQRSCGRRMRVCSSFNWMLRGSARTIGIASHDCMISIGRLHSLSNTQKLGLCCIVVEKWT